MSPKIRIALGVAFLACAGSAWSQTPVVTNVVNTGLLDKTLAPSSLVYIYGTFPQGAGRNYSITVGGQTGEVTAADNTVFITAEVPTNAPTGAQTLTVNYLGNSSNAFPITLSSYAPELANSAVTISSSTSQPVFGPNNPFVHGGSGMPVTLGSPAQPGEALIAYTSGLGQTNPPTTGQPPLAFTTLAATPTLTVSNLQASIARSGSGPGPGAEVDFFVPNTAPVGIDPVVLSIGGVNSNTASLPVSTQTTTFFTNESNVGGSVYYLQFANKNIFGYYNVASGNILYHYDLGFAAVVLGNDAQGSVYLYDFTTGHWFYTSPTLFPYLYDFTLNDWLYYFPATNNPGHYTSNPRYFSNLTTGKIITM